MHERVFTEGNLDIENIGIGGLSSTAGLGTIDYLQLVDTPLFPAAAIPEPETVRRFLAWAAVATDDFYQLFAFFNQVNERGHNGFDSKIQLVPPLRQRQIDKFNRQIAAVEHELQALESAADKVDNVL